MIAHERVKPLLCIIIKMEKYKAKKIEESWSNMEKRIKNKVIEIQHNYCGESVETKLYWAIKETEEKLNTSETKPKTN